MTPRAFLIRGLLAGLLAGLATFIVGYAVGEPQVDSAILVEEAGVAEQAAADDGDNHADGTGDHTHANADEAGTEVSRADQRTWGLLTGTLAVGVALGGIVALVAAGTVGRLGRLLPGQSTAVVSLVGFVAFALVPFMKYPATPPAVGSGDTIGQRTALYFGFVIVSVAVAVAATYAAVRLSHRLGAFGGVVAGAGGYLVVMAIAGSLFATVNEVGDFPADALWYFRRASLFTLATMWAVIGVALTGLVSRLYAQEVADAQRRQLAASL